MTVARILYTAGVVCAALIGFFSPVWYLGFAPLAVGLIWGAYDLTDIRESDGNDRQLR